MNEYENIEGISIIGQGMGQIPENVWSVDWGIEQALNLHQVGDLVDLVFDPAS